jgi:predicted metal-binding membrane protein
VNERAAVQSGVLLAAVAAACWLLLFAMGDKMPMGAGLWLGAWTVMMAAMMLPSAAPIVLLYGRRSDTVDSTLLMTGYLLVWAFVGVAAYAVDMRVMDPGDAAVGSVLIVAGIYQLTPLKRACLKRCRSPLDFLVTHWRKGRVGALRLGAEHSAYCVGCCWALMAVLVVAGAMGRVWVVAIAAAVAAEKLLPAGQWLGRVGGIALVGGGIAVAF